MTVLYGVDMEKPVTPLLVRDAIICCFSEAHCEDAGLGADKNINQEYCRSIVKKAFEDTHGDFDRPTRQSLLAVLDNLAAFSKGFRNPDIIKKHYEQIMQLMNRVE